MDSTATTTITTDLKRKRSPSPGPPTASAPVAKSAKTTNQLSINYLARQSPEDLPLINKEDALPSLLNLLSAYSNVLDRHESLASNLGARPLGPILIKRFERCFDAPPKIVAAHHRSTTSNSDDSSPQITWLEVIEFARSHPGQFTLTTFSEGKRVCQFYYPQKQLRVQISEEDFLFINSGRCQELIPPLPIWEDEEKEVGTCDVLEAKLKELTNAADMVAARTRQLSHRLKGRKAAILERRAEGGSGTPAKATALQTTTAPPSASGSNFVAVNTSNGRMGSESIEPVIGSSATLRNDLLRHFESLPHNQEQGRLQARNSIAAASDTLNAGITSTLPHEGGASNSSSLSPVPANVLASDTLPYTTIESTAPRVNNSGSGHRPSSSIGGGNTHSSNSAPLKHNFSRPLPPALENTQPFRPLCQAHMDSLPRGQRVIPPCDRCRRLRMDCVKNLTSCAGCTRKHARCHWRDVSRDELGALDHLMDSVYPGSTAMDLGINGYFNGDGEHGDHPAEDSDEDDSNPLEDLEALGQKEEQDREDEEGLRNAKELARQGYHGDADQDAGQANGTGHHSMQLDDIHGPPEQQQVSDAGGDDGHSPHHSQTKQQSYDPVHDPIDDSNQPHHATNADASESRGFLAVNQS